MTKEEAIDAARAGQHYVYLGSMAPPEMGDAVWDSEEGVWLVRVANEDVPYSCGAECCGFATLAVVAVEPRKV